MKRPFSLFQKTMTLSLYLNLSQFNQSDQILIKSLLFCCIWLITWVYVTLTCFTTKNILSFGKAYGKSWELKYVRYINDRVKNFHTMIYDKFRTIRIQEADKTKYIKFWYAINFWYFMPSNFLILVLQILSPPLIYANSSHPKINLWSRIILI